MQLSLSVEPGMVARSPLTCGNPTKVARPRSYGSLLCTPAAVSRAVVRPALSNPTAALASGAKLQLEPETSRLTGLDGQRSLQQSVCEAVETSQCHRFMNTPTVHAPLGETPSAPSSGTATASTVGQEQQTAGIQPACIPLEFSSAFHRDTSASQAPNYAEHAVEAYISHLSIRCSPPRLSPLSAASPQ